MILFDLILNELTLINIFPITSFLLVFLNYFTPAYLIKQCILTDTFSLHVPKQTQVPSPLEEVERWWQTGRSHTTLGYLQVSAGGVGDSSEGNDGGLVD